jgi:hypothetical protein
MGHHVRAGFRSAIALSVALLLACTTSTPQAGPSSAAPTPPAHTSTPPAVAVEPAPTAPASAAPQKRVHRTDAVAPPAWLGTRILPRRPDGWGQRQPTPPRLRDRRLYSPDHLPPPPSRRFVAGIQQVPAAVARRSTWTPACPLPLSDLRYVTVSFWGFDDRPHTGEMIVNASAARSMVAVFRRLYRARFPIEEMRVRRAGEIDAPPTGDYNNTDVFDCRPATGGSHWSQHAFGLAIDINPFHNPYLKGDLVVPELAEAYLDRDRHRPGMIHPGDVVTRAFADIGWGWGGNWSSLKDWQHFSSNGH